MNISRVLSYMIVPVTVCIAALACHNVNGENREVVRPKSLGFVQPVMNPGVPRSIDFAGEHIDLDREDMYEKLDRELTQMCYAHSSTLLMLKRANRYFPIIAPILKQNGVPEDLVYLACIESTLNPRALSPAKAAGLWQFMPATARQYGLEVNDNVDERYNIEKSTAAAARYLKSAHRKYGNWESAMASYNAGQGKISGELGSQHVDSSFDLWLVDETSRYVYRVLAAKIIMENPARYGFDIRPSQFYPPLNYERVSVDSTIDDLAQWAKDRGTTYALLKEYNTWLCTKTLTVKDGKSYELLVPKSDQKHSSWNPEPSELYNPDWAR